MIISNCNQAESSDFITVPLTIHGQEAWHMYSEQYQTLCALMRYHLHSDLHKTMFYIWVKYLMGHPVQMLPCFMAWLIYQGDIKILTSFNAVIG
jgi:hypothetical protein